MNRPLIVGIAGAIIVLVAIALTIFIDREPDRLVQQGGSPPAENVSSAPKSILDSIPDFSPGGAKVSQTAQPKSGQKTITGRGALGKTTAPAAGQQRVLGASDNPLNVSSARVTGRVDILPDKPTFDIVRVNRQGDTVSAGRAEANTVVTVLQDDKVIGRARADKWGEWVLVPQTPISAGTHSLTVVSRRADGTEVSSDQSVVVVVPGQGKDVAGNPTKSPAGPLAIAIPKNNTRAPIVLQTPGGIGDAQLSLDAIDYGQAGRNIGLSGRAPSGTEERVYLDNKFVGRATADEKDIWRLNLGIDIPAGLYKMRVDRVDKTGNVIARIELPFSRAKMVSRLAEGAVVFVQPGNSLWRLARQSYGKGLRYTEIYEANKDQIRDPHLIYPGQVFVLPAVN